MKRTLSALLALCLLAAPLTPAMAEEPVSAAVEAPVGEAWTAGAGNGLSVDGGDGFAAWTDDAAGFAVSAPEEDEVPVVGPDAEVQELGEAALTELTGEGAEGGAAEIVYEGEEALCDDVEIPVDLGSLPDLPDSDALFAGYVRRIFYGNGRPVLMATNNAGRQLTGQDRVIYSALKQAILQIADGSLASTVVRIPIADVLGKTRFTASDLGVEVEYSSGHTATQASLDALSAAYSSLYSYNLSLIINALWCDCTYELYWYQLYSISTGHKRPPCYRKYDSTCGEYVIYLKDDNNCITVSLPVLAQYAARDTEDNILEYTVDTQVIAGAKAAAATAQTIVDRYAGCSDYAKLFGYAYEICNRVTYNSAAASGTWDMTDQNPWKLIWVFDGDTETNVVCEGYAMAFSYLCELSCFDSGVRCFMVSGTATGPHAWNIVRMGDGNNYLVDVTWMDGSWANSACDDMADWISQKKGHGLFLAGGTGSVEGGYTVNYRTSGSTSFRTYDANTLGGYSAADLVLASEPYTLNGFQSVGGDTYYFDDGAYVTGERTIDGTVYDFGANGILQGTSPINVHAHVVEPLPAVPATCTETGLTEGKRCSVCSAVLVEQDVEPALGHAWGSLSFTLSGDRKTMTAARTCLRNATHTESETVNTVSTVALDPTCTAMGDTTYTAAFKNPAFTRQTRTFTDIPALGHDWGDVTYAWSDDNSKVTATRACQRTGCTETESEEASASSEITTPPTCTDKGDTTYSAAFANAAFEAQVRVLADIPALGHDLVHHDANAPTCTEAGWNAYDTCSRCDYTTYVEIPALKHDLVHHDAKAATCTGAGWEAYDTCSRCDYTTYVEIPALKHDLVHHDAKAPTCTAIGWNAYDTCSRCDYSTYAKIAALGHDIVHHDAKAATCTEAGCNAYDACQRAGCGYTTFAQIPAPGHSLTAHARVDATDAAAGAEAYWECSVCRALFSDAQAATRIPQPAVIPARASTAAEGVTAMIDALPDTAGTSDRAAVEAARAAYDALSDEEKALVNADKVRRLTNAERQVDAAEAQKTAADQAAANAVIAAINALPATAGTGDRAAVEAARAAYDALTDEQKRLVSAETVSRLTLSESQVKAAEEDAAKIKLTKAKVTVKAQAWTGKALKPKVTVKLNGKALKKGTDYKVSYKNNTDIGKARVTVTGVGKYTGTVTGSFIINPKVVSGLSLKAGAGKLTASWKKVSGVTGYQIQYGLKSSFKGAKKATLKKDKTVKATLKKLTAGKRYYVRIRAYKIIGKKTYWSDWSKAVKSGKIK